MLSSGVAELFVFVGRLVYMPCHRVCAWLETAIRFYDLRFSRPSFYY